MKIVSKPILVVTGLATLFSLWACNHSWTTEPDRASTEPAKEWQCILASGESPNYSRTIGCEADFKTLASPPLNASIPGALSMKTVIDRDDDNQVYFQNSQKYAIHWEFVSQNLSGNGKATVPRLAIFNETEYFSQDRRFILGAVTYYQGPKAWVYEVAPYDKANAEMISLAMEKIRKDCYFGDSLYFHPTSDAVALEAAKLGSDIRIYSTDSLFAGIDYQPLNYGLSYGRLVFTTAKKLKDEYLSFRDIVVLDEVPNDISVVSGIITQQFQTPLSHINVLSQNRGTPNMALRGAHSRSDLKALEGKWVKFSVAADAFSVSETDQATADAWWEEHRPAKVGVPKVDLETREMKNVEDILDLEHSNLAEALKAAIPAYGGKATHFSAFPHMDTTKVKFPKAFAIPVYYYWQFMEQNGFIDSLDALLADSLFNADPKERDKRLKSLRKAMVAAPVDSAFEATLMKRIADRFPGIERIRFRSSTNAEDLEGFTGAGLYDSKTGGVDDPSDPILGAVKEVWASVFYFRAFEERAYRNIDHNAVGMALLVHPAFSREEANGVAITANPFDPSGLEPGFYINAQKDDELVVASDGSITADQFIYHFERPDQPMVFLGHSSLVADGETVLTKAQAYQLGTALQEIHRFFRDAYGTDANAWYAMDTEFKLDQPAGTSESDPPIIMMKQARPYPGFGSP